MLSSLSNPVIEKIEELSMDDICEMSSYSAYIERGFKYYRQRRVEEFSWNKNGDELIAIVQGSEKYHVRIKSRKNVLGCSCTCLAWSNSEQCKHVICTLFTIKNLLESNPVQIEEKHKNKFLVLKSQLESCPDSTSTDSSIGSSEPKSTEVIIKSDSYRENSFKISIRNFTNSEDSFQLRQNLEKILSEKKITNKHLQLLNSYFLENTISLKINTQSGLISVNWDPDFTVHSQIELESVGKEYIAIKKVASHNNSHLVAFVWIGESFIVDLENKKLGRLKNNIWSHFTNVLDSKFYSDCFSNQAMGVKIHSHFVKEELNFLSFYLNEDIHHNLILKQDGKLISPETKKLNFSVSIFKDQKKDNESFINSRAKIKNSDLISENPFASYLSFLGERCISLSHKVKRKKLFKTLCLLSCVESKESGKKIISDFIKYLEVYNTPDHAFLKKLFHSFISKYNSDTMCILNNHYGEWMLLELSLKDAFRTLFYPCEIYKDAVYGLISGEYFSVQSDLVIASLASLKEKLDTAGLPMYFEKKLLKTKRLDINIDVSVKTNIDWFEIKPEILCEGKLLSDEEWKKILLNMGTVEDEEGISLIDLSSLSTLQIISKLLKKSKKLEKKEKTIAEISRLQILDWIYLRNSGVKVKLSCEDEKIIESLLNFKKIKTKDLPDKLNASLREYQKDGYSWLSFLYEHRFGACLADDMGLGKTIQAITLLAGIKEEKIKANEKYCKRPHLIILPPTLVFNWKNEIEKFYPDLRISEYLGSNRETNFTNYEIIITTYEIARRDIEKLKKELFNVIIFDEAQNIKNIYAERTSSVRQLNGGFKLCLTGTPLENHIGEYYSIIDLAVPGLLEEYKEFMSLAKGGEIDFVIKRTKPFVLRRTKNQILKELPEKIESDVYLDMTDIQKSFYVRIVGEIKQTIAEAYRDKPAQQAGIIALTALLRLRQICVSPKLVDKNFKDRSPKLDYLLSKVKELTDEGHSCLLFSQFTGSLDIIQEEFYKESINFVRMDGKTTTSKRKDIIENFQRGNTKIFLISLKTGGVGLNLTQASYVFHVDPWWNPAVENQATDRAHRIGQKNIVFVNRLLMHNSIEEKMMVLKQVKKELYDKVMNFSEGSSTSASLTKEDFEFLLN